MPGYSRSFTSFTQAANEAGESRIFGGIHFEFDNHPALDAGRALGGYIVQNFLRPLEDPGADRLAAGQAFSPPGSNTVLIAPLVAPDTGATRVELVGLPRGLRRTPALGSGTVVRQVINQAFDGIGISSPAGDSAAGSLFRKGKGVRVVFS
jgi:hypothetical protein